ncbi:MAG TPA: amidohydrolase family protein [Acidimicrobiales bacterium]|nr:amidohydrolase family protein [Acidimicrobiales bacterium]
MSDGEPQHADTLIDGALVVTMNGDREVVEDGAVAIGGGRILAVGPAADVRSGFAADDVVDGRPFVVTPGLVNTHIHITGEPLTRGFVPDDTPFEENVFTWLCPLYAVHDEDDERTSAQLAAAELLLSGTTSFIEAGTIRFLDAVVDGLQEIGIRGRVGRWVWDLPPEPAVYRQTTAQAVAHLEDELARHGGTGHGGPGHGGPGHGGTGPGGLVEAWPMVVGHTTCSDELWKAAAGLAAEQGTGLNFHMSPAAMDPEGFLASFGQRPMVHLDELGVLSTRTVMAHCVHVDDDEIAVMARRGVSVAHCPTTCLKVAYGVTQIGRIPEMLAAGINVAIGTDGNNASNYSDMYRATYLVAGLFKDARRDPTQIPAELAYEMATLHGARALGLADEVGSVEVGKRADLVLHDRRRPEWTPLLNVANQLVYSADGRGVHTVFVDGRKVVDGYRLTTVDAGALYERAQRAGEGVVARSGLPDRRRWKPRS